MGRSLDAVEPQDVRHVNALEATRALPARKRPHLWTPLRRRSSPGGWDVEELGTPPAGS